MNKGRIIMMILASVALILTIGCNPSQPTPTDFDLVFRYGINAKNELNTFTGTYTKDMIGPPFFITTNLSLTQEELGRIYRKMVEIDFFSYPEVFSVPITPGGMVGTQTPYYSYYFKVSYDSKTKELRWDDKITNENQKANALRDLIKLIRNIIESKGEYKILPQATSAYS